MIFENSILEVLDSELKPESILRVLWISSNVKEVVVVEISNYKKMEFPFFWDYLDILERIREGRVRILNLEPDIRLISPEENYLKKYKIQRETNWNIIKEIIIEEPDIYIPKLRGMLVRNVVEKTGKSKKEIYRLLKRYWFYGKTKNGLLRNYFNCGASGKKRKYKNKPGPKSRDGNDYFVTDKDWKIFEKAVEKYIVQQKMNLTATHQHMCEESYHSGYYREHGVLVPIVEPKNAPTLREFTYWYNNKYSYLEKYTNRKGKRKAHMDVRAFEGDATERAQGIGYLYEIDSTPADIILVAEDRKTIIGTPTLYIVKDVYSRAVTGFYASLSPASTIEQMMALENAATNKVEFCRQYGIDIQESDWPCENLPQLIAGDRGELKAKWAENLVNIKVDVSNAPSYRGDLKPFVEQHFRLTNKDIKELLYRAGAKPAMAKERGDSDPARKAALTIYEFTQFMIIQIITFNKSALNKNYFVTREMFEEKIELSPNGIWNWGKGKKLLHVMPRNLLRFNLLPMASATVTRWGIKFSNMFYTSQTGLKQGWFEEERIEGEKVITIRYDPRNISSIFLGLSNGKVEQCYLTEKYKEYEGLHVEDVKAIMKYKKEEISQKEKEEKQHKAVLNAFSKKLVDEAIKKTKEATSEMSFYERQKNKRETKKSESKLIGSQKAWTSLNSENVQARIDAKIFTLPKENELTLSEEKSEIQRLFEAKNKEGRRHHETME